MLGQNDVCVIIVTYNCDDYIIKNINALIRQAAHILIIDNGSTESSKELFANYTNNKKVSVIYNNENMGIAYALNQGLKYAQENKYKLFLTMDQDSKLGDESLKNMIDVLNFDKSIISVGPDYRQSYSEAKTNYTKVSSLITSGNLTYTQHAINIGGYNDKLFIDSVDFDFSLSLRMLGKHLAIVHNAKMDHKIGETETRSFLFSKIKIQSHTPVRHYYIYRNHYYLMKKFIFKYPLFCIKKEINLFIYSLKLIGIHSDKRHKINMICRGVKDAIRCKYGKFSN